MIGSRQRPASRLLIALSLASGAAAPALAQPPEEPIGRYVVDARASLVPFSRNVELADLRDLRPLDTPGLGLGFDVGAHAYFFRLGVITFGLGGSFHYSAADQQPGERSPDPDGPTIRKRFTAFSSQLSFNFGGRDGWSYLSGGLGASRLSLFPLGGEEPPQRMTNTLNYGGGVRWFTSDHLAFSLDLRFYAISPLPQLDEQPGSPRMTQMALNAGVSFK